ncbi:MAG: SH3 domain-containing protein [Alphaproteobacteria bacterium]|nr:SH3 domain-containing protein [Alphaproteobacteria bacterium]
MLFYKSFIAAVILFVTSLIVVPASAQIALGTYDVANVASNDVLNIRQRADASALKIGALPFDLTEIEVIAASRNGKWGLVNYQGVIGWVSTRYLQPSATIIADLPAGLECSGTEPFWSLSFLLDGSAVGDWSPLGLANARQSFYNGYWSDTPMNRPDQSYAFTLQNETTTSGVRASGIIRQAACNDGMSDQTYGYAIDVLLSGQGQTYVTGCCSMASN